ncbi:hydrolase [Salmonella enterica subsp. enterica serovar Typhi]|nr:hydrolase [Salmonella enterica subsp. enterica serovar Typhi]
MSSKIFCKSWGAEYIAADVVRFRLWATGQQKVMLRLAGKDQEMQASGDGWFTLDVSGVTPGTEYTAMAWCSPIRLPAPKKLTSMVRHM